MVGGSVGEKPSTSSCLPVDYMEQSAERRLTEDLGEGDWGEGTR